jgi:hypothetical protein
LVEALHQRPVEHVAGAADRCLSRQTVRIAAPVRQEQRPLGVKIHEVDRHRRYVGDQDVRRGQQCVNLALESHGVPRRGVGSLCLLDEGEDSRVSSRDARVPAAGDPGVRLVDQPHLRQRECRTDDLGTVNVHRGVVVLLVLAFPARCVENGAPIASRDGRLRNEIQLRSPHRDQLFLVEGQQCRAVPTERGFARNEHPVVGLHLVRDHAELVALAVVDVHMQHRLHGQPLGELVELLPPVREVHDHLGRDPLAGLETERHALRLLDGEPLADLTRDPSQHTP